MEARLFAVDPSLTCSGWALFTIQSQKLLAVGKIRSLPPTVGLPDRLSDLQRKISTTFEDFSLGESDLLVCEAPTTMKDPRAALRVEQVRGMFETLARTRGMEVPGRVNPRSVQRDLMGLKGRQLARAIVKETAVHTVKALFDDALADLGFPSTPEGLKKHQDVVDAMLIGNLALARLKAGAHSGLRPSEIFELHENRILAARLRGR